MEEGVAAQSSILTWRMPWTEDPGDEAGIQVCLRSSTLEKELATHCNILAWKIPWTEEPGGLQFMGSQ